MNTNPHAKVILCYGDSNTWGQSDDKNFAGRYAADVRWTGQLQRALGEDFYVIEEGLGGRTTNLGEYNAGELSYNGLAYFATCLASHSPLDMVIIMLGTNDLKTRYDRPVAEVADALSEYVHTVKSEMPTTAVLLVSPVPLDATAPKFAEYYASKYDDNAVQKSKALAPAIKELAAKSGALFFDASTAASAGKDGIHFDERSHNALAKSLLEIIEST